MVKENRLAVSLDEIESVRFDCKKCGAHMTLTPGYGPVPAPLQCIQCHTPLAGDQTTHDILTGLMNGLQDALKLKNDKFDLRLMLKE